MRRIVTIVAILLAIVVLGHLAHSFDLLSLAKSIHGAAAQSR